jgi:hypothetical protein
MICCGSGSFRLWKSFGSGSGSGFRQYLPQFSTSKKIAQNLAFSMSEAAYFSETLPLFFDNFYYILLLCWNWDCEAFRFR